MALAKNLMPPAGIESASNLGDLAAKRICGNAKTDPDRSSARDFEPYGRHRKPHAPKGADAARVRIRGCLRATLCPIARLRVIDGIDHLQRAWMRTI